MTSKLFVFTLSCSFLAFLPLNAHGAEETKDWSISGSAAVKSDYVFRGFSQTDENASIQGSVAVNHKSGLSVSLWGANVDFNDNDEASSELDITGAYTLPVGEDKLTLGGIYYAYPGANSSLDYDYVEGFATYGSKILDKADATASIYYSPDFFAGSGHAVYTNVGLSAPLPGLDGFSVNGGAGYQWIEDEDAFGAADYADWTLAASYTIENITLGLSYSDTDIAEEDCNSLCSERVVARLEASF